MKWYENNIDIDGTEVYIKGIYRENDSMVLILYEFDLNDEERGYFCYWSKPVNLWAYQEILAEDVCNKYMGKIKKLENNLPSLIEREKLNKRI